MQFSVPAVRTGPKVNYGWFNEAWQLYQKEVGIWIAATLAQLLPFALLYCVPVFSTLLRALAGNTGSGGSEQAANFSLFGIFWIIFAFIPLFILTQRLNYATYMMANKQVRGERLTSADVWGPGPGVWKVFGLGLLVNMLIVIGGAIVVPALLVVAFTLPAFSLVADDMGVFEALQRSVSGMSKDWLNATFFSILLLLLVAVSGVPCGLGLLVTYPMYNLITALARRDMIGMPGIQTVADSSASGRVSTASTEVPVDFSELHQEPYVTPLMANTAAYYQEAASQAPRQPRASVPEGSPQFSQLKATKTNVAAVGGLTALVLLAVGFGLIRLAHPQTVASGTETTTATPPADNHSAVEANTNVDSSADPVTTPQSQTPADTASSSEAVVSPPTPDIENAQPQDNGDSETSPSTIATSNSSDTMNAYAPAGSGLDDTPVSNDALQNTRLIQEDLRTKSLRALSISHSSIYALHGYVFSRPAIQSYFASQPWYQSNPAFSESLLSSVEQENAQTIRAVERSRFGYGRKLFDAEGKPYEQRDPLKETASPGSGLDDTMLDLDTLQHGYVTGDELSDKSLAALSVSYNAIYAAHGYVFKRRSLQALFEKAGWYRPNPGFSEADLSETEKANLQTIRAYERSRFGF